MFVHINTEQSITLIALRKKYKNISFPETGPTSSWLKDNGYALLEEVPEPTVQDNKVAENLGVKKVGNTYKTDWTIRIKTDDELLISWQAELKLAELKLPEYAENIIDALGPSVRAKISPETMEKYNNKKDVRGRKPN